MKRFTERLRAIERQRERKPIAPCMVIRPGQDVDALLAAFRRAHGREPWRVFTIKRAPPRP